MDYKALKDEIKKLKEKYKILKTYKTEISLNYIQEIEDLERDNQALNNVIDKMHDTKKELWKEIDERDEEIKELNNMNLELYKLLEIEIKTDNITLHEYIKRLQIDNVVKCEGDK